VTSGAYKEVEYQIDFEPRITKSFNNVFTGENVDKEAET
jgi:hypothetical protein